MTGQWSARTRWLVLGGLIVLVVALALGASRVTPRLIPTMGVVVLCAALLLPPRMTALIAGVAVLLALPLITGLDEDYGSVRMANLVVVSVLSVTASWFLDRRFHRIEELRREEAAVLASIPDAVLVLDGRGRLVQANAGLARLFPDVMVGEHLHPLLGHVLADGSPCPGGCALDGLPPGEASEIPVEGERITHDGMPIPVAYTTGRVVERGIVVALRDVSARVRAEQDRRVLLEAAARQREQAAMLQSLAPPQRDTLPRMPGLELDMWRTRTDSGSGAGELVDVSALPDGRVLLLLVDSDGADAWSMRDSWIVLHVCRAHMAAGAPLGEMITRCAATLEWDTATPNTAILGVIIEPETGHVQAAMGGAPPPLVVRAQGGAEWLEAAGRGLGSGRPGSRSVVSSELGPGDTLVLYSDGVVDGGRDVVAGLAGLRSTAVALRKQPVGGLARRALDAVQSPSAIRDATLVLVRLATIP